MVNPPSYAESTIHGGLSAGESKGKTFQIWDLHHEVTVSRSEYIAAAVSKSRAILEERARSGISQTTLVLIPYEQNPKALDSGDELVGFSENVKPVVIALQSEADTLDFWSQPEVVREFQTQLSAIAGIGKAEGEPIDRAPLPVRNSSQRKGFIPCLPTLSPSSEAGSSGSPVKAAVREIYLRSENLFGLFETVSLTAVVVKVAL